MELSPGGAGNTLGWDFLCSRLCKRVNIGNMNNEKCFVELVKEKRVLFITTKNIDYIRNTQELRLLEENAGNVEILYSSKKSTLEEY